MSHGALLRFIALARSLHRLEHPHTTSHPITRPTHNGRGKRMNAYRVKPLVWESKSVPKVCAQGLWDVSDAINGEYSIHTFTEAGGPFFLQVPGVFRMSEYTCHRHARSAAQAHHDARIWAAIEPIPTDD